MGAAKLLTAAGGGITLDAASTATDKTITIPARTGTVMLDGPAFGAYQSSGQTPSGGVWTKVGFQTEEFDTNSNYDKDTNYRFQPTVAGYYQINAMLSSGAHAYSVLAIYKNGSSFKLGPVNNTSAAYYYSVGPLMSVVYLNGSTDYVEIYVQFGTSTATATGQNATYFNGSMVRAA